MTSTPSGAQRDTGRLRAARSAILPVGLLLAITVAFYWKILLTHQFSLLTGYEGVNQAYAWLNFWAGSIRAGTWPIWDPYTFSGHVFSGEMQTAACDPLNLLFVLFPFNRHGVLSPELYHMVYALTHFLAACFMYWLVRELELGAFAGLIAGICFSFGGIIARFEEWPHLLHSAIWLPLIFVCLLRALRSPVPRSTILYSSLCGLGLGMSILAGGLHFAIMEAIVIFSATLFFCYHRRSAWPSQAWRRATLVIGVAAVISIASGAVQLLPSVEYSHRALRFLGATAVPASDRIPYGNMSEGVYAHSLFALLIPTAFGQLASGEYQSPYLGVFPLLLAVIGVWKNWAHLWVRYLSGLAIAAFLYSLGGVSLLHGFLYAVTPFLSMAREANRFMYLADFALAVLAAFGADTLFSYVAAEQIEWRNLSRGLKWIVLAGVLAFSVPALIGQPQVGSWMSLSLLLIGASYALFRYIIRGRPGAWARFLTIALILFDLSAFDWSPKNVNELTARKQNQMERLLTLQGAAGYLKSRAGLFRSALVTDWPPNAGDLFHVQLTTGNGVTLPTDYTRIMIRTDLLNARYFIKPASVPDPSPVYKDMDWKVYENPHAYPRAWIVHRAVVEASHDAVFRRLDQPGIDLHQTAVLEHPLPLEPVAGPNESVLFRSYEAERMALDVTAGSAGLLVLSEMYYPGWRATVNGKSAEVRLVDGALRGVEVPAGTSRVELRFVSASFRAGAAMSLLTLLCILGGWLYTHRHYRTINASTSM